MIKRNEELLTEIILLIGKKVKRFYLKYSIELNFDIYMLISLLNEVLESVPAFEIDMSVYKNRYKLNQKMFDELSSSQGFGIRQDLIKIQYENGLSFEAMKNLLTTAVLLSYGIGSYPGIEEKVGVLN